MVRANRSRHTPWEGTFEDVTATWLRGCDRNGQRLLTGVERATPAEAKANTATTQADKLAARLKELGIAPEQIQQAI